MVEFTVKGDVAWLTLQRPDRANALSANLVEGLLEAVDQAIAARVRVLVFSGAGKTFCGGFDLGGLTEESDADLAYRLLRIELLLQRVHAAPCYTIALTHGTVSGAGADLAAVCVKRVAASNTRFRFPGIGFGILLGTRRLLSLIGDRARSAILEQQVIDASEALEAGLVTDIVEPREWNTYVEAVASRLAAVPVFAAERVLRVGKDEALDERDLGVLAKSLIEPGLKERVIKYWEAAQGVAKAQGKT